MMAQKAILPSAGIPVFHVGDGLCPGCYAPIVVAFGK